MPHATLMFLYSLALTLVLALGSPLWMWRLLRRKGYRHGLRQRMGAPSREFLDAVGGRPVVWVHAVSVGECMAASALVRELEAALPGHVIVVSTTTPTGQAVARERFGADRVFFYPLDFRFAVRRSLRALRPELLVLMESELWPRMLAECGREGIPVAVANARVSDRSLPRYLTLRPLWRHLLRHVSLVLAQSPEDARRWMRAGVPVGRIGLTGNLKFDTAVPPETPTTALLRSHLPPDARVLVAGSTHPGEDAVLMRCFANLRVPNRVLILAPRHPERAEAVATQGISMGLRSRRVGVWRRSPAPIQDGEVLVLDTVGELGSIYSLATCAFVGGSLVERGGQNPLEPAQFGVPILMGESFENFRDVVKAMQQAEAINIVNKATLSERLATCMAGTAFVLNQSGERARAFHASQSGATERTVAELLALLGRMPPKQPLDRAERG